MVFLRPKSVKKNHHLVGGGFGLRYAIREIKSPSEFSNGIYSLVNVYKGAYDFRVKLTA